MDSIKRRVVTRIGILLCIKENSNLYEVFSSKQEAFNFILPTHTHSMPLPLLRMHVWDKSNNALQQTPSLRAVICAQVKKMASQMKPYSSSVTSL